MPKSLFGSKQCYLTYRIGTFQLTRITLEILTTIRIKKIQDSMFVTCSCAVLGVFVGHCYWGGFEVYVVARGEGTKGKTCTQLLSGHGQA